MGLGFVQPVTISLHRALQQLSDSHLDRVLWADSVCINQTDVDERNRQVRLMAKVYATASRVLVWLGEDQPGDNADVALEGVCRTWYLFPYIFVQL